MTNGRLDVLLGGCTQCGQCRDVCIVERLGAHSITSFLCGDEDYSSWLCSSCWRCQEACPEGVDIHAVMMEKRSEEEPPTGYEVNFRNVLQGGYALSIDEGINELRKTYGLDMVKLLPVDWVEILLGEREG